MARPLVHQPLSAFAAEDAELQVDIAVVGAGVSGAYSAWRLKQAHPDKRVALFEYGNRVGGRLYTTQLPGMPHVNAELGGMRYIPDTQPFIKNLIDQLGLVTRAFPMGAPPPVGESNNLLYLRRRLLRARDLTDPEKVPYLMNQTEQGMTPDQLQKYVMDSLVPNAANLTQDQWNHTKVLNGEDLYKQGFWNLLYDVLSSEAYQFMNDAGGYYTNVANSNAVLSLPVFEFGPNVVYRTIVDGYDSTPKTLVRDFVQQHGGDFHSNHRLDGMVRGEDGRYSLLFVRTVTDEAGETIDADGGGGRKELVRVSADAVILGLPRRSLELVNWAPFVHDRKVRELVTAVINQAAFKMFLAYPYPWWRPLGLEAGRSITDMPLRQTFYFGTENEMGGDYRNTNSLMMVSYSDIGAVPFWKALENGDDFRGDKENRGLRSGEKAVPKHRFRITQQMVDAAQAQVREVHGLKFVPEPYSAVYHDWSDDPFGAGWHAWKAGKKFWEMMPRIRNPVPGEKVYVCGDAYSMNQGWVEGALQTAELVLEDHFGLPRPDWLPADYNLGY